MVWVNRKERERITAFSTENAVYCQARQNDMSSNESVNVEKIEETRNYRTNCRSQVLQFYKPESREEN
jgi:FtsZ-interacting cell division protein ZipA